MRILHIATLVTPNGAYGGPITVAVNQLRELQSRGHEVMLAAGANGYHKQVPNQVRGVPLNVFPVIRILPKTGFAGLSSPRLYNWALKQIEHFDIVHIHLARDLITLPVAWRAKQLKLPMVVQTHGMIDESTRFLARILDTVATKSILRSAAVALDLTDAERHSLHKVAGTRIRSGRLPNGVAKAEAPARKLSVVEILYLARLHQRKRPEVFVKAAIHLAPKYPQVKFTLVGPDEGMGAEVSALIRTSGSCRQITWEGAIPPELTLERMKAASVYVLPSINEPFPMSVLEAMSVGLPVIVTDSCGIADDIQQYAAGQVVDTSLTATIAAIELYITRPDIQQIHAESAQRLSRDNFSIRNTVDRLEAFYATAMIEP